MSRRLGRLRRSTSRHENDLEKVKFPIREPEMDGLRMADQKMKRNADIDAILYPQSSIFS
jgi:hypothetical protein